MEFKPPFIDVTYHREEIMYKKRPGWFGGRNTTAQTSGHRRYLRGHKGRFNVDTVPHLVCGGFTPEETEDALFTLYYLGITNVLLLQGDADHHPQTTGATTNKRSHHYASDLVKQVALMNKGRFLHEETENESENQFLHWRGGVSRKTFRSP